MGALPGRDVTIVEMLPAIALEEDVTRRMFLMDLLAQQGVHQLTSTKITGITGEGVEVELPTGGSTVIPADTVVLALGLDAERSLDDELTQIVAVTVVGDAVEVRNAVPAIREGVLAGCGV